MKYYTEIDNPLVGKAGIEKTLGFILIDQIKFTLINMFTCPA